MTTTTTGAPLDEAALAELDAEVEFARSRSASTAYARASSLEALIAELRRLRADLIVAHLGRDVLQAKVDEARTEVESLREDGARLDWLIEWMGHHDTLEGSGVRDWNDNEDARAAIDAARSREEK